MTKLRDDRSGVLRPLIAAALLAACAPADQNGEPVYRAADAAAVPIDVTGFATPESVLYDEAADIYLVSNINGDPFGKAGNGFISRVWPDGQVQAMRWIDGQADGVTLHAPKGMAIHGDTLFVADIDSVRAFHRETGAPLGARGVPGATFLNDLAVGPDGRLYVTDTGMNPGFEPSGSDAVHRFDAAGAVAIARGAELAHPNGIVVDGENVIMVPFGGSSVYSIPAAGGAPEEIATLPAGQLDGVVRLADGTLLVSSWEGQAVYRVRPGGGVDAVAENVEAPADIGWDTRRERLLIPLFMQDRVEIRPID